MPGWVSVRIGGWALILGAVAFIGVFSFLAARFNYPAVLDGPADMVLPQLLATGGAGRLVWAVYAVLPLARMRRSDAHTPAPPCSPCCAPFSQRSA